VLSDSDKERIGARVRELEARSGAEIVTVLAERCDHYPEIPWRAFALGAALTAAGLALVSGLYSGWPGPPLALALALGLSGGLFLMLLTAVAPPFARLFLDRVRAESEARQYAEELFLQRELYAAPARRAVLLLVARFERKVVVLPDSGLRETLAPPALDRVIAVMTMKLARGEYAAAFDDGLATLEPLLAQPAAGRPATGNSQPDEPLETRGP
jgi:putative membrane protein